MSSTCSPTARHPAKILVQFATIYEYQKFISYSNAAKCINNNMQEVKEEMKRRKWVLR
jgi:hypothetical protein